MTKLTLTMLDTGGIQNYIFSSNRLQENIGASELVYRATTLWAFAELPSPHNVKVNGTMWMLNDGGIEREGSTLQAEVIYAGGGNTMVLFKSLDQARIFTERITERALRDAPGLLLFVSHLEFDQDTVTLAEARTKLLQNLAAHKQARLPSAPQRGLGVTANCQSTGFPAVQSNQNLRLSEDEEIRLISRETRAKLGMVRPANDRLREVLGTDDFPFDVDKLGRIEGEESYVAVVHADGNRMGSHLEKGVSDCKTLSECKKALRTFSEKINSAGFSAIQHVVDLVKKAVDEDRIPYETERGRKYLPIRPLVFGGDDLTLLCNGQIGVSLAAAYLEAFAKAFKEKPVKGLEDVHARAGVAIVKMHYPFARAYQLSEQLVSSAKRFIKTENDSDCSAIDWHYATGGLSGSLEDVIRPREYEVKEGKLNLRPLRLDQGNQKESGRYWRGGLENVTLAFKNHTYWSKRRNKLIGLREALRKGRDDVRTYRRNFDIELLPELAGAEARETGWQDGRCVYFDAVELFPHYLPLEKQEAR